jgi:hypothetical protein
MINENGIIRFEKDDVVLTPKHELAKGAPKTSLYGYKLVAIDGTLLWDTATEEDFRKSEAIRRGIKVEDVESKQLEQICVNTGPTTCSGTCYMGFCNLIYNPQQHYYYCQCV